MKSLAKIILGYLTATLLAASVSVVMGQNALHDSLTTQVTNFPVEEYFQNAQIHSITIDSRGLVYFALAKGIVEFDGIEWRIISVPSDVEINALALNSDGRIFGAGDNTAGYLYVDEMGNTKFQSLLDSTSTFSDTVIDIIPANEKVFFIGLHSISVYENKKFKTLSEGSFLSAALLNQTLIVSDQENGLQFLNAQQMLQSIDGAKNIRSSKMRSISDDSLIIATRSSGIQLLSTNKAQLVLQPWTSELNNLSKGVSFSSIDIIKNHVIAFGSFEHGVFLTDYDGNIISRYNKESGLFNNNVFDVLVGPKSTLWVALNEGVSLIRIPNKYSGASNHTSHLDNVTEDSVVKKESLSWLKNIYKSTIGSLFAKKNADTSANSSVLSSAETFASIIRRVEYIPNDSLIFGGAFSQTQRGVQVLDQSDSTKYEFSYDFNAFRFSYTTNDYERINGLQFQVKLQGMDRDWSTWSQNTYREYTNLSWGDYSFLVRAQNDEQTVSRAASFSFSISPPWYESNWFYLVQFLVIMAALVVSGILNKTGKAISLSEALIAIVVIIIFRYLEFYIEPYLDEYSNDIAVFKIGISIVFGFSLEFIEELFHKTVAKLTGLKKGDKDALQSNESISQTTN